jgi:hypothetical protein
MSVYCHFQQFFNGIINTKLIGIGTGTTGSSNFLIICRCYNIEIMRNILISIELCIKGDIYSVLKGNNSCKTHQMSVLKGNNSCKTHQMSVLKGNNSCKTYQMSVLKGNNACKTYQMSVSS